MSGEYRYLISAITAKYIRRSAHCTKLMSIVVITLILQSVSLGIDFILMILSLFTFRARKARGDSPRATPCSISAPIEFRSQPGGNRILCLDGGGMRGLIQIEILCELERMTGKKITELFDVIMGTSTGGILALGLVYKKMTLTRLRQLFVRLKDEIFSKSRVGGYNSKALEDLLKKELGCDMKMSDKTYPK